MVERLLEVKGLKTYFFTDEGVVRAVDGIDLYINKGETLGIVGESGSGKTVTALSIMRLIPTPPGRIVEGAINYNGKNLIELPQAQMLELLNELKAKLGMAIMLITHDMGVIAETAQRVAVMYGAQIVEEAAVGELFKEPLHPYTQGLLRSIPRIDLAATQRQKLEAIPGTVPTLRGNIKPGCRFAPRCALAKPMHFENDPSLKEIRPGHKVACFLY